MTETVNELLRKTRRIVPGIAEEGPEENGGKLNILLLGTPQQNLCGIMNEVLGGLDPLDCPMMAGYRGTIEYGEEDAVFRMDSGVPERTDPAEFAETLKKYNSACTRYSFTVTLNNPLLAGCSIRLLASDADYGDVSWNAELSGCDYLFLTMNAAMLLSMAERKVIRKWLAPHADGAYGVILTGSNLILEDDRRDIEDSLRTMFREGTPIFRMPETDAGRLADMIEALKREAPVWEKKRRARAEKLLLMNMRDEVALRIRVCSESTEEVRSAVTAIREAAGMLPQRQKAAVRHAWSSFIAPARLEALRTVGEFRQDLDRKIGEELEAGVDMKEMAEILPSYIEDAWRRQADSLFAFFGEREAAMQRDLQTYVERDFRNYIEGCVGGDSADYVYAVAENAFIGRDAFAPREEDARFLFDMPEDTKKAAYVDVIASGIALALLAHPVIGIAVAALGSGSVKKTSEAQVERNAREALSAACTEYCGEYSRELTVWVDEVCKTAETNLDAFAAACYREMTDSIVRALNGRMADQSGYEEELKRLLALKADIEAGLAE